MCHILQYVKAGSGWTRKPLPKNGNGAYLWSQTESDHFYLVWREGDRKRCEKAGTTPAETLLANCPLVPSVFGFSGPFESWVIAPTVPRV